jgi:cytoskeletal protein RodZ
MKVAQNGFAHIGLVVLVVVVAIIGMGGWYVYSKNTVSDPEPNIVPEQQKTEEPNAEATTPEESVASSYKI